MLAGGAAWIAFAPIEDRGTDELSARLARLEVQTRSTAEAAAAAVPDNASAAKIDELSARLARLETASAAAAPENGRTDIGRIDDLAARLSRLETAAAAAPPDSGKTDTAAIKGEISGEISGKIDGLSERLAKLEAAMPAPVAPDPTLAGRLAALEAAVKPIAEHVADLDRQFGDNATAAKEARERAESVAKAMAEVNRADADQDKLHQSTKEELAGLNDRLDAFEGLVKALKDQVAESAAPKTDDPLRFALVAAGLHSALERGEPFAAELAAAKAVAVDPALLAGFAPFADTGVPKPDELFRELTGLIPEMLKVSAPAANGNYLDRLQAHAEKLVRIRPVGDRAGRRRSDRDRPNSIATWRGAISPACWPRSKGSRHRPRRSQSRGARRPWRARPRSALPRNSSRRPSPSSARPQAPPTDDPAHRLSAHHRRAGFRGGMARRPAGRSLHRLARLSRRYLGRHLDRVRSRSSSARR